MEAKPDHFHHRSQILSRNLGYTSPPSLFPRGPHVGISMRRNIPPYGITAINNRFRSFCYNPIMATKDARLPDGSIQEEKGRKDEDQKEDAKKEEVRPPPPEQPEPGDCCGSGCVRCVWDVYYEELEAYNSLYGSDPKHS